MSTYAHPESLVNTDWLAAHLDDSSIRIVESNEDVLLTIPATSPMPCTSTGARI